VEDVTDFVTLKQEGLRQSILTEELQTKIDETERMRQAQRLLAMGQLAGGVAHDFNNLLSVIMLNCDLLARDDVRDKQKGIDQIRKTAERAANMTHQLLAFSRTQVFQPRVVSMNTIIRDLEPILKRLTREGMDLRLSLDANLCNVVADVTQVEQILLNLVANARDAIPGAGRIEVQTETVTLDEMSARGDPAACPGKYARLCVRDTGIGMDAVTQARIFEPFFTTKQAGKGTGLGLATIYGIVAQNQGTIRVISEIRKGTSFNVFWPAVEAPVQMMLRSEKAQPVLRSARILVVEDEDDLRNLIFDTLMAHDFQVENAENGEVALSKIEKSSTPFDLIITDVRMPVMTGSALKRELDRRGIRVKVLFMSGYSQEALFDLANREEHAFLEKPFTGTDLLSKIDAILR
jgi:nitrogen-specific signal transduction histidine kinase/CheY-like chemotaxis protein